MAHSNLQLVIAFCELNEEQFADYLDEYHEIEPTDYAYVINQAKKEAGHGLHQSNKEEQQDRGTVPDRVDLHGQKTRLEEVATVRPLRRDITEQGRSVRDLPV